MLHHSKRDNIEGLIDKTGCLLCLINPSSNFLVVPNRLMLMEGVMRMSVIVSGFPVIMEMLMNEVNFEQ
jgi:hypothetical protein